MALTLQPVSFANTNGSRIALLVTNLLGDTKAEWFSDSASEAMDKAYTLAEWPDTLVYVYDTDNAGNRTKCTALITYNQVTGRHGWRSF